MKKLLIECPKCGISKRISLDSKIYESLSPAIDESKGKEEPLAPRLSFEAGEVCPHAFTAILSHRLWVLGYECEGLLTLSRQFMELLKTDYFTRSTLGALTDALQKGFNGQDAPNPDFQRHLHGLLTVIFEGEEILNDNKVKIFALLSDTLTAENYPLYYHEFLRYQDYTAELAEIQSLYYTIKVNETKKAEEVADRIQRLVDIYPRLFLPWFILGNTFAVRERIPEAIQAMLEAQKYKTNPGNMARLANNVLVCFMGVGDFSGAKAYADTLSLKLRIYPHIRDLIKKLNKNLKQAKS